MRRNGKGTTYECVDYLEMIKHDVKGLLNELKVSPKMVAGLPDLPLKPIQLKGKNIQRMVAPKNYDQMWRYGGDSKEENKLLEKLTGIVRWIQREIRI